MASNTPKRPPGEDAAALLRRLVGLGPVAAPPHVFALDGKTLRYGRFVASGGAYELRELRAVELPPDAFVPGPLGGALREPAVFAERLGQLVGALSAPVKEASLVLPDAWVRVAFVEVGELPRPAEARDEIVRWKVKRLLPFRVEDLRLSWSEVAPLPRQAEPRRVMVSFALEALLAQLEDAFAARGIWLGQVTSESLALLPAVRESLGAAALGALAVVHDGGYTLLFTRRGEPVLYRFKALDDNLPEAQRAAAVERDLKLTRAFVADNLPDLELERVVVAAPAEVQGAWQGWLAWGLGRSGEGLEAVRVPLTSSERVAWATVAPMLGAARQEVS